MKTRKLKKVLNKTSGVIAKASEDVNYYFYRKIRQLLKKYDFEEYTVFTEVTLLKKQLFSYVLVSGQKNDDFSLDLVFLETDIKKKIGLNVVIIAKFLSKQEMQSEAQLLAKMGYCKITEKVYQKEGV
jgi:hypothetical protein